MPERSFNSDPAARSERDHVAEVLGQLLARHWLQRRAPPPGDVAPRAPATPSNAGEAGDTTTDTPPAP